MCLTWLVIVKKFFLPVQGNNTAIIHFSFLPWSFRPFSATELVSVFIVFKNIPDFLVLVFSDRVVLVS